jgi:hypothetical protein
MNFGGGSAFTCNECSPHFEAMPISDIADFGFATALTQATAPQQ